MSKQGGNEEMAERLSAILFPDLNPFIGAEFVSELTAETTATTRVQSSTRDIDLDSDMQTDTEKAKKPHEYKPRVHLRLTSMFWVTPCSLGNPKCVGYLPA